MRDTRDLLRAAPPRSTLRVLYLTDRWDAPYRYRCQHAIEQLRLDGVAANAMHIDDADVLEAVASYSVVVLFRLEWSRRVDALLKRVRAQRATLIFDCDDLIFDPGVERFLPFLDDLPEPMRQAYRDAFTRLRRTFDGCDYFLGSTPTLVGYAKRLGKEGFVHPNLVSPAYERYSRFLRLARNWLAGPPILAYFSGSNTHDRDLASISGALAEILKQDATVRLLLCGFINLPHRLRPFADRITHLPFQDWRVYPWAIARCRAVLAPATVVNEFTNGKSAAKFFEAGIFGVATVATPTEAFQDAITHGEDGLLARNEVEWCERIRVALDPEQGRVLGERARETVLARFSFAAHRDRLRSLLLSLIGQAPGALPEVLPTDPEERGAGGRPWCRAQRRWRLTRQQVALLCGWVPVEPSGLGQGVAVPLDPARFEPVLTTIRERGAAWLRERGAVIYEAAEGAGVWMAWSPSDDLRRISGAEFESLGPDPRLISPPLLIRSAEFRYLILRMKVVAVTSAMAQFFWASQGAPGFREEQSVRWPLKVDREWRTYVLDLADTGWKCAKTITSLRLDPLNCPGSVALGGMALLADLAQLLSGGDVRRALAARYLRGVGVECGALQNPLAVPDNVRVFYVDRLTAAQAREHYPELAEHPVVRPDVVGDLQWLPLADGSVDFCIGNHLLEHARDPIGALDELLRVVRVGGVLFVSAPDVNNPLDRRRPVTPFAHLLEDHERTRDHTDEDIAHYREAVASSHPEMSVEQQSQLFDSWVAQGYSIHFHTFDATSYHQLLTYVCRRAGALIEEFASSCGPDFDEYVAILRRLEPRTERH